MNTGNIIDETVLFVKETLKNAEGGHDWFHTQRVFNNALLIAKDEKCDPFIVALGALLHDIADAKFHDGDETIGPQMAHDFLSSLSVERSVIEQVVNIIKHISFRGGQKPVTFTSKELQVVQDADRLDAMGAIGIARAFNYGGFKNRALYDPQIPPKPGMSPEAYKNSKAPTINHFYEKLLLLKDRMNTEAGKKLAQKRHEFMESFLAQFYNEWNGEV